MTKILNFDKRKNETSEPILSVKDLLDYLNGKHFPIEQEKKLQEMQETFSKLASNALQKIIADGRETFQKFEKQWRESMAEQMRQLIASTERFKLAFPEYEKAVKIWAQYGWALFPEHPGIFLDVSPKSQEEADEQARLYFEEYPVEHLLDDVKSFDNEKNSVCNEAVALFKAKKYRGCAHLLFELIDKNNLMLLDNYNYVNKRPTGRGAIYAIEEHETTMIKSITLLFFISYIASAKEFYKGANDFRTQPKLINRNFLAHGMLEREVTEKDCIQLFVLYFSARYSLDSCRRCYDAATD